VQQIDAPTDAATRARLAVAWATGFQLFRDLVQFGLTLTLVRLLPADAYGQFGFVTTLLGFFTLYSFREFLGHTIQVRDEAAVHYQDHFTAGAIVQVLTCALANLTAVAFRFMPAYAPAAPALHVMSVLFLLDLPSEFRVKMLERNLDWRRLRSLQAIGFVSGGALSIALAFAGAGVYALLIPTLLVPIPFAYDLFVRNGWRPTWAFSWDRFGPAWRFGWTRIATVSFLAVASLTESAWLAKALGFAPFGIYGRAVGLAQLLCGRAGSLLALAIYPVLTRLAPGSQSYQRASALYLRAIGWTVIPAAFALALVAGPVVSLLYGAAWLAAIPLVPAATAGAALGAIAQTGYTLLLAYGRQGQCVVADAWKLAGTVCALAVLLPLGPNAYLLGLCAVQAAIGGIVLGFLWQGRAVTATAIISGTIPAVVGAIFAALAMRTTPAWLPAQLLAFAVVYLATLRILFAGPFAELVSHLPQATRVSRWLGFTNSPAVELSGGPS
jgi:O-antigen/teichoic acid export membrane protein